MANWAIAIGVNQYEFLHPLKYAKNDALHICNFLGNEAKFDRIFYFSDDSPDFDGKTTKPFRNNLLRVFNGLAKKPLRDGDNFWFFFAGHGILGDDGIDYLMPSDGDPDNLADTGISVNRVIQNLRLSGAGNVILALDACRNQVRRNGKTRSGEGIGRDTDREAKIADVISIAACSPTEYSYEVEDLKHGAFTYALVEGLGVQGRCATAAKLNIYLKHRVPELAKTKQTPRMLLDPMEKGHLILMPKYAEKSDLAPLRADAYQAFSYGKWDVAKRLWMQILAVDGANHEAIEQIERIVEVRFNLVSPQLLRVSDVANSPEISLRQANARTVEERQKVTESQLLNIDLGNGVTLELVKVPAGKFMMGSPDGEGDNDERPQHQVILQEFLIGKYAVTNAQWQAVMKTKGSANCDKKFQGDLQPVVGVSWHEARAFCAKVQQQTGKAVRLPTEAEWEYAARGANQSKGFIYAGSNNLDEVGWYGDNSGSVTHPVGQKTANELGIYDMSGNVWEWCLDEWHDSYANKPENLKKQGNQVWGDLNVDDNDNRYHPLRGGSWGNNAWNCRAALRDGYDARLQFDNFGFRAIFISFS
ncbi:SUMF1/EgtB/PvdO family nonheme iron enzyme [Phormidium tenue]|uniref:SUMF1/EgtB/PvdO family nonheme iron enzyme n=1 Tax=Phormidium tenue FACHB-1050 TaxID=2692857 RepID=A0ABR8CG64_9CYAN|nr:SUMF1/EgtB/PvdO family nonheme iron enzyme [Phormidium tenue]MBD2319788.1 SUMF1/EgtB/PvdO family nonheme iron enzyme [Phormidium tenue FACHB-1050]